MKVSSEIIDLEPVVKNQTSVPLKKEDSKQKELEDKQSAFTETPPYDNIALAEVYNVNGYHAQCCRIKAKMTTLLGFSISDSAKPEREKDGTYMQIEAFLKKCSKALYRVQLDYEIYGNGFGEIVRDGKGAVTNIVHIPARDTDFLIEKDAKGKSMRVLRRRIGGVEVRFVPYMGADYKRDAKDRNEYIHLLSYNPKSDYFGVPDYIGSLETIYLDKAAKQYNTNKFENPVPETIISTKFKDETLTNNIKSFFRNNFSSASKAGKKALHIQVEDSADPIGDLIKVDKIDSDIKESSFRGLRSDNREEVLAVHGVPPRVLMIEAMGKLSGGNEGRNQMQIFMEVTIIPRQNSLEEILNDIIENGLEADGWQMTFNKFQFANSVDDATFYQAMITAKDSNGETILDAPEARNELGYAPRQQQSNAADKTTVTKNDKFAELAKLLKGLKVTLESMRDE